MMQSNGTTFLSNLGTSVRNNPVPAVMTSVGLLWLMMSQNRPPTPRPVYRTWPKLRTRWGSGSMAWPKASTVRASNCTRPRTR